MLAIVQMEMLVILTHLTGRTLVLPDHLASDIYMMRQPVSLWDYYDFEHLRQWIPAISMNQYLDIRCDMCHTLIIAFLTRSDVAPDKYVLAGVRSAHLLKCLLHVHIRQQHMPVVSGYKAALCSRVFSSFRRLAPNGSFVLFSLSMLAVTAVSWLRAGMWPGRMRSARIPMPCGTTCGTAAGIRVRLAPASSSTSPSFVPACMHQMSKRKRCLSHYKQRLCDKTHPASLNPAVCGALVGAQVCQDCPRCRCVVALPACRVHTRAAQCVAPTC